jgi:hypothetical protein
MATLQELERALVNADKAGDTDAARKLAAVIARARQDVVSQIPGTVVPETIQPKEEPSALQQIAAIPETALTLATGGTTGVLGGLGGFLGGLATELRAGKFGTQEAANRIEQAASAGMQALTYAPSSQAAQEQIQAIGEVASILPPVLPQLAAPGMAMQAVKQQAPLVSATAQRAVAAAAPVAQRATQAIVQAPAKAVQAAGRAFGMLPPEPAAMEAAGQTASALRRMSVGSAGASIGAERRTRAEMMPVPFTGSSALTAGQSSRNFAQLQFEKEAAKLGEVGAPLRERVENQTATMIRNFDALIDLPEPVAVDPRAIGQGVDRALVNRVEIKRRQVRDAYEIARAEGAMQDPVELAQLASRMVDLERFEGVASNIATVRKEALRLGALVQDADGNVMPGTVTLDNAELLRQFVNEATDWQDPRQSLFARRINESIDAATENAGGASYRAARKLRSELANEFENVGITAQLLGSKRGTNARKIAFEDVFDKIIISSPVDEMNKLRSTLLKSGTEGKQAWADLKSAGIKFIKDSALSPSQRDSSGNPLLSPDKLHRTLRALDQDGKLEALYGKKQAQTLRDLADIATDIYTAPPGAVNTSGTASALMIALDTIGTAAFTGMPAPAVTALRESAKYVRNKKTKARIEAALRGQVTAP